MDPLSGAEILKKIERCGRVCYKSEDNITDESAAQFVRSIIKRGHESVLEHVSFSVRFVVDRGVSHEIVRHRLASFSQESTRYCDYSMGKFGEGITVILPSYFSLEKENESLVEQSLIADKLQEWKNIMERSESAYKVLISLGSSPQEARAVLPNSLKTELVMTANLREWRHFLRLRTSRAAHPQMREVTVSLLAELKRKIPVVFDDIEAGNG